MTSPDTRGQAARPADPLPFFNLGTVARGQGKAQISHIRATGGGYFFPDEESTLPTEGITDKANFGFVVYIGNSGSADGNLEFQYQSADIRLRSQSMTWYTVSANKAIFEGSATINGQGSYTFRVKATDGNQMGQADSFDIRIWTGTDTEADPLHKAKNDLAGGNIVVHKK